MMDELPAIIHRLSLQLWCPDQVNKGAEAQPENDHEKGVDPFQSPPEDPVDANGNPLDLNALSELTLNGGGEMQSLFSQKNLLRLAALTDSHRTLSLFTPGIRDVVFRAWSGRGDGSDPTSPVMGTPSLARTQSIAAGSTTTYTFSDSGSTAHGHLPLRPSLLSMNSATSGLGSNGRSRTSRKKKTRVVNLRRSKPQVDSSDVSTDAESDVVSVDVPLSEPLATSSIPEEPEPEEAYSDIVTTGGVHFTKDGKKAAAPLRHQLMSELKLDLEDPTPTVPVTKESPVPVEPLSRQATMRTSKRAAPAYEQGSASSDTSSVILEQAWIMKMAGEIARRVYDEKKRQGDSSASASIWSEQGDAPPAYEAATQ